MKSSQAPKQKTTKQVTRATRKELKKTKLQQTVDKHTQKKKTNLLATRYMDETLSHKALERLGDCGEILKFATTAKRDKSKLAYGNFCGKRFCPMCNMRKAIKDSYAIEIVLKHLEEQGYKFAFLTLTVENVKGEELSRTLDKMNHSAKKLFERARIKRAVKGYIRKIEVTYNSHKTITKSDFKKREEYYTKLGLEVGMPNPVYDTYHPHMHFILILEQSYFVKKSKTYLTQAEWLENWQSVNGTERVGLDVRKIESKAESNAVKEISKYSAKDSDLYYSQSVFLTFYFSLKGRRLLTFSGVASDSRKAFKKGELDYIKEREHDERRAVQERNGEVPSIYVDMLGANWKERMTAKQRKVREYALKLNAMTNEEFIEYNEPKDVKLAMKILGVETHEALIQKLKNEGES